MLSLSLNMCMLSRRLRSFAPEPDKDVVQSSTVGSNGLALLGVRFGVDDANTPAAFNTSCIGACPFVVCIRCAYVQVNLGKKSRKYHWRFVAFLTNYSPRTKNKFSSQLINITTFLPYWHTHFESSHDHHRDSSHHTVFHIFATFVYIGFLF